ncbi:Maf family nucleotide pyrophosphatase [Flavobacteriales bacterium]|nr:Maf family nucleotide pyrophosphatase [Flavobacteriales bacterium]
MINLFKKNNFILGSNSPRRKEILQNIGLKFSVCPSNINENFNKEIELDDIPVFLAEKKANALKNKLKENDILITADTIVIHNNELLSKPENTYQAKEMLGKISGKSHKVITGVCLSSKNNKSIFSSKTIVTFNDLDKFEIEFYINKFKPFDKAGSYGIQEWIGLIGIKKIEGSYTNVVGLPASMLYVELKKFINL